MGMDAATNFTEDRHMEAEASDELPRLPLVIFEHPAREDYDPRALERGAGSGAVVCLRSTQVRLVG